ncbi:MAG: hypothetical protein ACXVVU_20705 [Solirubrobacteraceae bacterium]
MTAAAEPRRRARLALAALSAAALATALVLTSPAAPPPSPGDPPPGQRPADPGAHEAGPPSPAGGGPDRAAPLPTIHRVVRRFLSAFLDYEVGRRSVAVRRRLRATATPALARALLSAPPRALGAKRPPRAGVAALEPLRSDSTRAEFEALLARPGAPRAVMTVTVDAPRGRPFVCALR